MAHLILEDFYFIAVLIALSIFAVLSIPWILDKSPLSSWFKSSGRITVSFITVPAFLFGLAISTVASGIWNKHVSANLNLVNENSSLRTLISISSSLPPQERDQLNTAIYNYVTTALNKEWPAMKIRDVSNYDAASPEFEILSSVANKIAMMPNQNVSTENRLQSAIDNLRHERLIRDNLAKNSIHLARWPFLYLLSFLLLFTVGLLQLQSQGAMRISLTMGALCIGVSLLFIHLNGSPYGGIDAVNPDPLSQTLKLINPTTK